MNAMLASPRLFRARNIASFRTKLRQLLSAASALSIAVTVAGYGPLSSKCYAVKLGLDLSGKVLAGATVAGGGVKVNDPYPNIPTWGILYAKNGFAYSTPSVKSAAGTGAYQVKTDKDKEIGNPAPATIKWQAVASRLTAGAIARKGAFWAQNWSGEKAALDVETEPYPAASPLTLANKDIAVEKYQQTLTYNPVDGYGKIGTLYGVDPFYSYTATGLQSGYIDFFSSLDANNIFIPNAGGAGALADGTPSDPNDAFVSDVLQISRLSVTNDGAGHPLFGTAAVSVVDQDGNTVMTGTLGNVGSDIVTGGFGGELLNVSIPSPGSSALLAGWKTELAQGAKLEVGLDPNLLLTTANFTQSGALNSMVSFATFNTPEPASISLLAVSGIGMLLVGRRRK